jgi:hypothetical protein
MMLGQPPQGGVGPIKLTGAAQVVVEGISQRVESPGVLIGGNSFWIAKPTIPYTYTVELNQTSPNQTVVNITDTLAGALNHPSSITVSANTLTKQFTVFGLWAPSSGYLIASNAHSSASTPVETVDE